MLPSFTSSFSERTSNELIEIIINRLIKDLNNCCSSNFDIDFIVLRHTRKSLTLNDSTDVTKGMNEATEPETQVFY